MWGSINGQATGGGGKGRVMSKCKACRELDKHRTEETSGRPDLPIGSEERS